METVEKSVNVHVDVTTAYDQWTQFESFPKFMENVEEIEQVDDKHLHWRINIGGNPREFDVEITEQIPDQRIAWTTRKGEPANSGVMTFHRLSDNETRLMLQLDYEPQGIAENIGDKLGVVERNLESNLEQFKNFIEQRGTETGGWRGEIH